VILGAVVLSGLTYMLLSSPCPPAIPQDILDRINAGMNRSDIEDIIGSPPGDYRSGPVVEIPRATYGIDWEDEVRGMVDVSSLPTYEWETDRAKLELTFLKSGRVATGSLTEVRRKHIGPLDMLVWRIERLWRRWFASR
jgi:hypothetical protein